MNIILSGNLRRFVGFQRVIKVEANNISEGIERLVEQHPAIKPVMLDSQDRIRGIHRLFFNDELLELGDLSQPTQAGDELRVITAVAGG